MPLNTHIEREGETLKLRWGGFHVAAMLYAIAFERELTSPNDDVDYPTQAQAISPANIFDVTNYPTISEVCPGGEYTLTRQHHFWDPMDGEYFKLEPGDKLSFWRDHK
jgi:hypothetical protein